MFWRTVRGMIPHKTPRGAAAMNRLKTFEGVPPPYDHRKRVVVPQALRVLRLKPGRKYCTIGRLGHEFGWKYQDVVSRYVLSVVILDEWQEERPRLTSVRGQTRGQEKGQGRGLLRAEEGCQAAGGEGDGECKGARRRAKGACSIRVLGWYSIEFAGLGWLVGDSYDEEERDQWSVYPGARIETAKPRNVWMHKQINPLSTSYSCWCL